VVAVDAEFAQQHVQALRFGDEHGRAQRVAQVEFFLGVIAQQVLGEQDADDVVAVLLEHRKARVPSRTNGMKSSGLSVMLIASICARGTMMSRAHRSDT
jgi:hypothetical protein